MNRILAFDFGLAAYIVFLGTFLYAIGPVRNRVCCRRGRAEIHRRRAAILVTMHGRHAIDFLVAEASGKAVRRYRIGNQMEPSQRLAESVHA